MQMASTSHWLSGGILIAAGLFQFSGLKEACLSQCRSPVTYFMLEWREGNTGALRMGLKHGVHCVGCCWVLMGLLFMAGVMNLLWMAVITGFVLLEKVMPKGDIFGRVGGVGMVIWGICLIVLT
jgi:predicted metal-binding membrane protein